MKRSVGTFVIFTLLAFATVYFVGAIVLGSAAYVRGTTIRHSEPIVWASLPGELVRSGWRLVFEMNWITIILFAATVGAAVCSRLVTDFGGPATRRMIGALLVLGFSRLCWALCLFSSRS